MRHSSRQISIASLVAGLALLPTGWAAAAEAELPSWLAAHVGLDEGQIAPVVLERARALYLEKRAAGEVANACYMAMDATRPSAGADGAPGKRFYVICEEARTFRAMSSGYGNGRALDQADFSNGRQCAQHFSNAEGSKLTAGGAYVTAETRTSFKGYVPDGERKTAFFRTFLLFDGEGETDNAREREIGGHPAHFVKWQCRFEDKYNPFADDAGYVPFGTLVDYTGGRSNGCTTWSESDAAEITAMVEDDPTTLYIYPAGADIDAVANTVAAEASLTEAGLYWNAACLEEIGAPKFWPKAELQPIINDWRASLVQGPMRELPICD